MQIRVFGDSKLCMVLCINVSLATRPVCHPPLRDCWTWALAARDHERNRKRKWMYNITMIWKKTALLMWLPLKSHQVPIYLKTVTVNTLILFICHFSKDLLQIFSNPTLNVTHLVSSWRESYSIWSNYINQLSNSLLFEIHFNAQIMIVLTTICLLKQEFF